ncbi:MAG: hypothetical protein KDD53_02385 [Bdellovibrionales bacterium]|nr:hypothetical protein [Bdellovibrionales bacterium]
MSSISIPFESLWCFAVAQRLADGVSARHKEPLMPAGFWTEEKTPHVSVITVEYHAFLLSNCLPMVRIRLHLFKPLHEIKPRIYRAEVCEIDPWEHYLDGRGRLECKVTEVFQGPRLASWWREQGFDTTTSSEQIIPKEISGELQLVRRKPQKRDDESSPPIEAERIELGWTSSGHWGVSSCHGFGEGIPDRYQEVEGERRYPFRNLETFVLAWEAVQARMEELRPRGDPAAKTTSACAALDAALAAAT